MNVSVLIPALNEEATVAAVVAHCLRDAPLEVLVIDADSTDDTAARAAAAGARVINWREVLPDIPPQRGKGESLWRGVAAARGDVVVCVDADLTRLPERLVAKLAAPLADPEIHLVKATYTRYHAGRPGEGGRVTELTAKPLLRLFFPELSHIAQPLSGEFALRRDTALRVPFVGGYGVDVGLLIDVAQLYSPTALAQVDLGARRHRNRPLAELAPMAEIVARTIVSRAAVVNGPTPPPERPALHSLEQRQLG